jgi:hypothetical protein
MQHLLTLQPTPWLCMGDFNEILNLSEKWGACTQANGQMEAFRRTLEDCFLCDLGFKGIKYTWRNGRAGGEFTKERLDRVVANTDWRNLWSDVEVLVLANRSSDHHPILMHVNKKEEYAKRRGKPFRIEASWAVIPEFKEVIHTGWTTGQTMRNKWENVKGKLEHCKKIIQVWVAKDVRVVEGTIKEKTKELEVIQAAANGFNREDEKALRGEIDGLLEQEELKWR